MGACFAIIVVIIITTAIDTSLGGNFDPAIRITGVVAVTATAASHILLGNLPVTVPVSVNLLKSGRPLLNLLAQSIFPADQLLSGLSLIREDSARRIESIFAEEDADKSKKLRRWSWSIWNSVNPAFQVIKCLVTLSTLFHDHLVSLRFGVQDRIFFVWGKQPGGLGFVGSIFLLFLLLLQLRFRGYLDLYRHRVGHGVTTADRTSLRWERFQLQAVSKKKIGNSPPGKKCGEQGSMRD